MVRLSASRWLKTSVEFEPDGPSRLGAVVTNAGYSDGSTEPFPPDRRELWLRIRRKSSDYIVEGSESGESWTQLGMAHLHEDDGAREVECGPYACSPLDEGFVAEFEFLRIAPGSPESASQNLPPVDASDCPTRTPRARRKSGK